MKFISLRLFIYIMRLSFIGIFLQCLLLNLLIARNSDAQKYKSVKEVVIDIDVRNVSIVQLFNELEQKTEFYFTFDHNVITENKTKINISGEQKSVEQILLEVSKQAKLRFKQVNNNINVNPLKNNSAEKPIEVVIQGISITGRVTSAEDNEGLPGVNIVIKGTAQGSVTDLDGNYKLEVPNESSILVYRSVGFVQEEVVVGNKSVIDIILIPDITALNEIVVVGYGAIKKSDVVSSVAKVDVDRAITIPTTNINEMLRGQVAGVQVTVGSLRPGGTSNVIIRGKNSPAAGNSPIYIVDGVVKDDIYNINPDDITSIEILKDASAQAIYGARASNGVILVTTKRGEAGKINIDYHGYFTTQSLSKNFDLYGGNEYAQLRREAFRTDNADDEYEADDFVFTEEGLAVLSSQKFANWEDLVIQDATIQSHNISLSGGTEKTKIFSSFGYFDQDGIIPTSGFRRGTFRLNLDQEINDKLSLSFNIASSTSKQDKESGSLNLITLSPLGKAYEDDGSLVRYPIGSTSYTSPLWNIKESENDINGNSNDLYFVLNYNISKHFSYKLNTSVGRRVAEEGLYYTSLHSSGRDTQGRAKISNSLRESFLVENIFRYENQFNENHNLDVTLVQSIDERKYSTTTSNATGFSNDLLGYNGIGSALNVLPVDRYAEERKLLSFMGRVRYSLLDRYLITATARTDGSSVFASGNKWGVFPSGAVAWKIHNESFLRDVNSLDELKLRASYGSIGNEALSPYKTLGTASEFLYVFDGISQSGYLPSTVLPNPNLKWETTTSFNLGLDFMIINNLLSGSLEYYKTKTTDLLIQRSVSGITGYTSTFSNAGEVQNKGIELLLTANIIRNNNINWSITATYANNENTINDLYGNDENDEPINDSGRGYYVGQPIGVIYQHDFDGIWQEGENYLDSPQGTQSNIGPGNIRVNDTDGDGEITSDDRVFFNPNPDWFGSLATTFSFMGFDLLADFYFVEGAKRVNPYLADFNHGGTLQGVLNGMKVPYYLPENPSTSYPRPRASTADPYLYALAVQDASYIRLRVLSLAYNLPESMISKIGMSTFKIYATANNLFTITDYKSYSPEVNANGYPDAKAFTFGLRVGF